MGIPHENYKKINSVLLFVLLAGILVYLIIFKFLPVIMPILIAVLFALLLNPATGFLEDRLRMKRKLAAAIVVIAAFALLLVLLIIILTELYSFAEGIVSNMLFGVNADGLSELSEELSRIFGITIDLRGMLEGLLAPMGQAVLNLLTSVASSVPQTFISMVVFILSTYFMMVDKERFMKLISKGRSAKWVTDVKNISGNSIIRYVRAQLIIMVITFAELLIGLTIIELLGIVEFKFIFLAAIGIAILDALPVFGTGTVLIPWSIYGVITSDFNVAIAMALLYIVCLTVRQFVEPKVVGESLGIAPLVTVISMFIGFKFAGVLGMIICPVFILFIIQLNLLGAFDKLKSFFFSR